MHHITVSTDCRKNKIWRKMFYTNILRQIKMLAIFESKIAVGDFYRKEKAVKNDFRCVICSQITPPILCSVSAQAPAKVTSK